jgi:hypothetical protein
VIIGGVGFLPNPVSPAKAVALWSHL